MTDVTKTHGQTIGVQRLEPCAVCKETDTHDIARDVPCMRCYRRICAKCWDKYYKDLTVCPNPDCNAPIEAVFLQR
jgi:hypothetical protein